LFSPDFHLFWMKVALLTSCNLDFRTSQLCSFTYPCHTYMFIHSNCFLLYTYLITLRFTTLYCNIVIAWLTKKYCYCTHDVTVSCNVCFPLLFRWSVHKVWKKCCSAVWNSIISWSVFVQWRWFYEYPIYITSGLKQTSLDNLDFCLTLSELVYDIFVLRFQPKKQHLAPLPIALESCSRAQTVRPV